MTPAPSTAYVLVSGIGIALFVAERTHQWQSLVSRDWTPTWKGRPFARSAVILAALVIGWGEGLGFFVQSERAFWGMVFWVMVAHVILTGWAWFGAPLGTSRLLGPPLFALGAVAAMMRMGTTGSWAPHSWLGHPVVPTLADLPARILAGLAFAGAVAVVIRMRGERRAMLLMAATGVALLSTGVPGVWFGPLAFILFAHAIPCAVINARRAPRGGGARVLLVGIGLAALEWFVIAKSVWLPGVAPPDLADWWDLGDHASFLLYPLWMAPFLAHVAVDAIRFFAPPAEAGP